MSVLRLLNVQGIAGLAVAAILGLLLILQKGETRHWKKQSSQYQQLYRQEQAAFAGTVANVRAAAEQARAADQANARRVLADQEGPAMTSKRVLPTLALVTLPGLASCASQPPAVQPIPAVAEQRQCPAYPLPPASLLKPPVKTDFLTPTG